MRVKGMDKMKKQEAVNLVRALNAALTKAAFDQATRKHGMTRTTEKQIEKHSRLILEGLVSEEITERDIVEATWV